MHPLQIRTHTFSSVALGGCMSFRALWFVCVLVNAPQFS